MKVELDFEELDLVLEALHDKHVACSESIDFLPKVLAVNRLYNRLIELSEEYETSRLETFAKGLAKEALQRAADQNLSLQGDRAAVIKERDGQVKTAKERKNNGADNEMDSEDAIKLYNELVKSPEDRFALEKEIPSLIAARDKALWARKAKELQKETSQMLEQVAQDARVAQGHLSI
jgi:hypothetical protein